MALGLGINTQPLTTPLKWAPTDAANVDRLELWLKNDIGLSVVGGTVALWLDSSGNENNVSSPNVGDHPTYDDGGLLFDGDSQYMDLTDTITIARNTSFTLGIVIQQASVSNNSILTDGNNELISIANNSKIRFSGNDHSNVLSNLTTDDVTFDRNLMALLIIRDGADRIRVYKNGTEIAFNLSSTNIANDRGFDLTNLASRNDADRFFHGSIYELFFFSEALNGKIPKAMEYLTYKFNI